MCLLLRVGRLTLPGAGWSYCPRVGEQKAEEGEAGEDGASPQCGSVPVLLRQPWSRGKGMAAALCAFVIWATTLSRAVESRVSEENNVCFWEPVQAAQAEGAAVPIYRGLRTLRACLCPCSCACTCRSFLIALMEMQERGVIVESLPLTS